jgi:hypothetical protein
MLPCCKVPPGSGVSRVAAAVSATCDRPRSGEFLREEGPNDGWHTSTANSGSDPASLAHRLAPISLRPALRIGERNSDLRRGPDLLSNETSTDNDFSHN